MPVGRGPVVSLWTPCRQVSFVQDLGSRQRRVGVRITFSFSLCYDPRGVGHRGGCAAASHSGVDHVGVLVDRYSVPGAPAPP